MKAGAPRPSLLFQIAGTDIKKEQALGRTAHRISRLHLLRLPPSLRRRSGTPLEGSRRSSAPASLFIFRPSCRALSPLWALLLCGTVSSHLTSLSEALYTPKKRAFLSDGPNALRRIFSNPRLRNSGSAVAVAPPLTRGYSRHPTAPPPRSPVARPAWCMASIPFMANLVYLRTLCYFYCCRSTYRRSW